MICTMNEDLIPVVDLFAGPGGLAEGFCTAGYERGTRYFEVNLSIEKDESAHQTLELRAFFRQFPRGRAPEDYYSFLKGEITKDELLSRFPVQAAEGPLEIAEIEDLPGGVGRAAASVADERGDGRFDSGYGANATGNLNDIHAWIGDVDRHDPRSSLKRDPECRLR